MRAKGLLATNIVLAFLLVCATRAAAEVVPIHFTDFTFLSQDRGLDWGAVDGDPTTSPLTVDTADDAPLAFTQAGGHPTLNFEVEFCDGPHSGFSAPCLPVGNTENGSVFHEQLKTLTLKTPPGLLADQLNVPYCEYENYLEDVYAASGEGIDGCPPETQIGVSYGWTQLFTFLSPRTPTKIYNLRPTGSEAARWGAITRPVTVGGDLDGEQGGPTVFQPVIFKIRTDGDYGADGANPDFFKFLDFGGGLAGPAKIRVLYISIFGEVGGKPFLDNPTSCAPQTVTAAVDSYQRPGDFASSTVDYPVTGCDAVPFTPSIDVTPDNTQGGAPSGYTVGVNFPNAPLAPIRQSHLKDAVVKLPEGVRLSPTAAAELDGCTEDQFGYGSDTAVNCPAASRIGDVSVLTNALDADPRDGEKDLDPLRGSVYFAEPTASDPWRIFVAINDAGLNIKLIGKASVDEQTGQITTRFLDSPQTPFERFELKLRGGEHAVLQNPDTCGTHTAEADFTPWARPTESPTHETASFDITGPCPSPKPFNPSVVGSTSPKQAGSPTTSKLVATIPDQNQIVTQQTISLPAGLVGSLRGASQCPLGDAVSGNCPSSTKVGSITADVGAGGAPISVTGKIFLSQPQVAGDAASIAAVIPAKTGPIDLGQVVIMNRVVVRPNDAGLEVISGPIPTSLAGVPLQVRRQEILVDRPGFFRNPTSCALKTLTVHFQGSQGATASPSYADAATNCGALPFSPRLRMIAGPKNETGATRHPTLTAIVTQDPAEAAISRAEVLLPQLLRPDVVRLNQPGVLCQPEQFAANACAPQSIVGHATVYTPVLPQPLAGPVYIIQNAGSPLPRLVVRLGGLVSIDLTASNSIVGVRTLNVFDPVPDVPQSRFELVVNGGSTGILKNFKDLCDEADHADATFFSHSGATYKDKPELEVDGCKVSQSSVSISRKRARMSKNGRVSIRLSCKGGKRCRGKLSLRTRLRARASARGKLKRRTIAKSKFSIPAGKTRTVKLRVKARYRRQILRRRKGIKVQVRAAITGQKAQRRTVKVRGPRRRR